MCLLPKTFQENVSQTKATRILESSSYGYMSPKKKPNQTQPVNISSVFKTSQAFALRIGDVLIQQPCPHKKAYSHTWTGSTKTKSLIIITTKILSLWMLLLSLDQLFMLLLSLCFVPNLCCYPNRALINQLLHKFLTSK